MRELSRFNDSNFRRRQRERTETRPRCLLSLYPNRILHAISVPRRFEQAQLFKFQDKAADRRIGGVSEVLFQLLGGKFRVAVSRQDKLPQRFFFLCDLSVGQGFLECRSRLSSRKRPVQFMIYMFNEV